MHQAVVAWIVIFLSLIAIWIKRRREKLSIFKRNNIPGPEPSLWTGNLKEFLEKKEKSIEDMVKKYGKVFGFFLGMKPFLVVTDEELVKSIQVKEFEIFMDRDLILDDVGIPQPEITKAVPMLHGEEWKKHRALLSPLFSARKLRMMMPLMKEACDIFMGNLKQARLEKCVNLTEMLRNCNLDVMAKLMLGIDGVVQQEGNRRILESAKLLLSTDMREILPVISLCFPEIEPVPTKLRNIKDSLKHALGLPSVKSILKSVQEVICHRRRTSQRREDMLQGLMDEKAEIEKLMTVKYEELTATCEMQDTDKPLDNANGASSTSRHLSLSDDSIVGTAAMLLVAGFDNTSKAICLAAYYLSKDQELQETLREEVKKEVGDKENLDYEDLVKLRFMEQVILETLRLCSTDPMTINRIARMEFFHNGLTIPQEVVIIVPTRCFHRNPKQWTDPDKFDPERFSSENKTNINVSMYQPFGNGPRNCVGMRFAHVLAKYILAQLIRKYRMKTYKKEVSMKRDVFVGQTEELLVNLEAISL